MMTPLLLGIFLFINLSPADTSTVNRMIREATELMDSKPDSALTLAEKALDLSRDIAFLEGEAHALSRLGIALHVTGRSSGMEELEASMALFESLGDQIQYGWSLVNIANFHFDKGDYVGASERLQSALDLFTKRGYTIGIAGTLLNIAEIRLALDQPAEAMDLTRRSLTLYEEIDHPRGKSLAFHRMGRLHIRLGEAEKAIPMFQKSLVISQIREDLRSIGNNLEGLGQAYEQLGDFENALVNYRASLAMRGRIDDRLDIVGSKIGIAKTLFKMGDGASALPIAMDAYSEAKRLNLPKPAAEAARLLVELNKAKGDTKTALAYLEEYESIQRELFSEEKATAIANLEAVAALRNKEEQIHLLEQQRFLERIVLGSVVGLLTVVMAFAVYVYRERKKVISLAQELQRVGKQKDKILSIVSHDLRGPLASLSAVIELIDTELLTAHDWKELKPSLIRQFNGTDETLQDLLMWAKGQFEGSNPRIQPNSVREAVTVSEELLDVVARQKGVSIVNDVSSDAVVMCDRSHLLAILRNLVTNAVKFSKPGQTVTILDGITDGMRIVSVRDEGVGMSADRRDKLFEGAGSTTVGTAGEQGSGLGLVFVRDLVQRNGGRIFVESTEGKGSVFSVALPMG